MITAQEVQSAVFSRAMRGYQQDQVDLVLEQVVVQLESDARKIAELEQENTSLREKLYLLAQKIDEYRADEDNLKSALLNAQRMGENVVREAKQKADVIEREAKIRAEGIISSAQDRCREEELEFERIRAEVSQFKNSILDLYRQHIESLSTLPESEVEAEPQPVEIVEEAADEPEVVQEVLTELPMEPVEEKPEVQPAASFWDKELSELTENAPRQEEKPSVMNAFQGIRFSD